MSAASDKVSTEKLLHTRDHYFFKVCNSILYDILQKKNKQVYQVKESYSKEANIYMYLLSMSCVCTYFMIFLLKQHIYTSKKCNPINTESVIRLVKPEDCLFFLPKGV